MRRPTLWNFDVETIDKWPRLAREALRESATLGSGHPDFRITRASGAVMAERIRRADNRLRASSNIAMNARFAIEEINAILQGRL